MALREFHYRWQFRLRSSPEDLWPLVADTNRFNRETGVPAVQVGQPGAGGRRRLRFRKLGVAVEWEEQPFEWVRPHRFGVERGYTRGPVENLRVLVELTRREDGGADLLYEVWARPRNIVGLLAIPVQIGLMSARSFGQAFRRYDDAIATREVIVPPPVPPAFAAGGRARLRDLASQLIAQGGETAVVDSIVETIEKADDLTLARLRPYAIADSFGLPRRSLVETCLWATRVGLLDLQWNLICPECRGAKETTNTLREIASQVHCEACGIDFTVNFERSVELTFRPNPAIRSIVVDEYCVGGPQVTPHVAVQQLLAPRESRTLIVPLENGGYRLRASGRPGHQTVTAAADGAATAEISITGENWPSDHLRLGSRSTLVIRNNTETEQLIALERTAWSDQAATATEITSLQVFRDLFSSEALRPGEQISVGQMAVLFTDLRNSTRLYREIGDATAFGRVMNHFDVLRETIASGEGALVKTIGDAVMAVFCRPVGALRAILEAQRALAYPPEGKSPLGLKAGLHMGPCIAVTLNERLDYFGSTVNMAARLEALSSGEDVIISDTVYRDPEVSAMLNAPDAGIAAEPFSVPLKGFESETFHLWRIRLARTPAGDDLEVAIASAERPVTRGVSG